MYLQTGDVLYFLTDVLPDEALPISGNLIHQGNDHQHIINGDFQLYKHNEDLFILCKEVCTLEHDEHKTIHIPEGLYRKVIVVEYDHLLEESRRVID